jgi:hypothetical protein
MEPVSWLKAKYSCPKQRGRYAGGTNGAPLKKRKKVGGSKIKPTQQRVMVLGANGKTGFIWRPVV